MKLSPDETERFWKKVNITNDDDCWNWTAGIKNNGYGSIKVSGRMEYAHRVSYVIAHGYIPDGLLVCHHCDNRRCVNPKHLFVGTVLDNKRDCVQKGRHKYTPAPPGEDHHNAKLTTKDVLQIRELYASGRYTQAVLAEKFNISHQQLGHIVTRYRWNHI